MSICLECTCYTEAKCTYCDLCFGCCSCEEEAITDQFDWDDDWCSDPNMGDQ